LICGFINLPELYRQNAPNAENAGKGRGIFAEGQNICDCSVNLAIDRIIALNIQRIKKTTNGLKEKDIQLFCSTGVAKLFCLSN